MKLPSRWFPRRSSKLDLAATIAAFACSGVLWAASASSLSPELEGRIREALRQQQLALNQASVQVTSETRMTGPMGNQVIETSEEVFFGGPGQIRRDLLKTSSSPASQPDEGPGGWRRDPAGRFTRILDSLEPRELLATVDEFQAMERPQAVGAAPSGLQLRIRPKLQRFQIDKAFLWVDPQSGAPLRLEARFGMGLFLRDAQLEVDFKGQADGGPVLPSRMLVHIKTSMPGPRGGGPGGFMEPGGVPGGGEMSIEIRRDYSNYKFGLDLNEQFFSQTRSDQPFRQPGSDRPAAGRTSNEDPFEEISLLPNQARPSESQNTSLDEVVFIQGASRQRSGGNNEQREVLRDILGMDRGMGGPGGPGGAGPAGAGGFGGGMGGGGFGGGRGMRIAGSRANSIHGSLQLGFSGSALDARPYSLTGQEEASPQYDSWNAGISIGGALPGSGASSGFFPRRGQYFVNYSTTRGSQLQSAFASVPTLLERQGDFSATTYRTGPLAGSTVQIFDPVTGAPFADGRLPQEALNPTSLGLLDFIPTPNRDDSYLNYYSQQTLGNHSDRLNTRLNFPLSDRLQLAGGYSFSRSTGDSFNVFPELDGRRTSQGHNLDLSANTPLRPGLIQNVRLRYNRNNNQTLNPFAFQRDISGELGLESVSPSPVDYGLPSLAFTNYSSLSDGNASVNIRESITASESWMLVTGTHFLRMGGEYGWLRYNLLGSPNGSGSLNFAGIATSAYTGGEPVPGSGYDLADFLLGWAQSSEIQYGNPDHYGRGRQLSLFVNDNWRLHSRMTLQWGLRYDYVSPIVEKYNRISNLDLGPDFLTAETVVPGSVGPSFGLYPRAMIESDKNNFAPRLGLAYRLRSGPRGSILRAEYGVFYPSDAYLRLARELIAQPPFGYSVQSIAEGQDYLPLESAFAPGVIPAAANTYAVDPYFRLQAVQNWGLSLQQSLPLGLFASLGYAGARGTGLELLRAPNRLTPDGLVNPNAAQFLYLSSGASSIYHGLQLLVMRRMRGGFSLSGQYEYGKSLDNASTIGGQGRTVAQNDNDLASERGLSSFDVRHRLSLRSIWELPFGPRNRWVRDPGLAGDLLRDWYLSWTFSANSGSPFTARVLGNQVNNSGTGSFSSERASVTGLSPVLGTDERNSSLWFDTAAFTLPDPGSFGDAGRNTIPGPGAWTLDLSVHRSISIGETGRRLLISLRSQNVLNHVNYTSINTIVNSRGFGQVTATGPMRTIQLDLRFSF